MEMKIEVEGKTYRYEQIKCCTAIIMESVWENISVIPYSKQRSCYESIAWGTKYSGTNVANHYMNVNKLPFHIEWELSLYSPVPISNDDMTYRGYIPHHIQEAIKNHYHKVQIAIINKIENETKRHRKRRN
jgi:hypothetical protein